MAKKNVRDEPPKTQVTENAQLSDIVFILDKMEVQDGFGGQKTPELFPEN